MMHAWNKDSRDASTGNTKSQPCRLTCGKHKRCTGGPRAYQHETSKVPSVNPNRSQRWTGIMKEPIQADAEVELSSSLPGYRCSWIRSLRSHWWSSLVPPLVCWGLGPKPRMLFARNLFQSCGRNEIAHIRPSRDGPRPSPGQDPRPVFAAAAVVARTPWPLPCTWRRSRRFF